MWGGPIYKNNMPLNYIYYSSVLVIAWINMSFLGTSDRRLHGGCILGIVVGDVFHKGTQLSSL